MNKLDKAFRHLRLMAHKLQPDQGRIARRNARRKVLGAMKRLRLALDAEFPQIARPKPPKPKKLPRLKLPFRKRFKTSWARFFVEVVSAWCGGQPLPWVYIHETRKGISGSAIYVRGTDSDAENWLTLIRALACCLGSSDGVRQRQREEDLLQLWARFWSEPIPHDDLEVVAKHQAFLETLK